MTVQYRVKVRSTPTFLIGGVGVVDGFSAPCTLVVRVDEDGEQVNFGVYKEAPMQSDKNKSLGFLDPAQTLLIGIDDMRGVYASCSTETFVDCYIMPKE